MKNYYLHTPLIKNVLYQKSRNFCLIVLLMTTHHLSSFSQMNYDLEESFTIETISKYEKPGNRKLEDFYITDRLYFIPTKEVMHVTNTLDSKDNYVTTIIHERPEQYEKWMNHTAKTII